MTLSDTVREIIEAAGRAPDRPTPGSLVERIARETERHLDRVEFSAARYVRHAILLWEDWEVMLIAWEKGQITPIHDHRGVLGAMAVLSGSLHEERFSTPTQTLELSDSRSRAEGDLCEIGPTELHRLIPQSGRAVSLHLYRPPLRTMGIWEKSGLVEIRGSQFEISEDEFAGRTKVRVG
jgi:cysteine dioxygenase